LADYCTCGSIIISGRCTNKSCRHRTNSKPASTAKSAKPARRGKSSSIDAFDNTGSDVQSSPVNTYALDMEPELSLTDAESGKTDRKVPAKRNPRRASKCIKYNLFDKKPEEE
jgi:hypothetical protein